MSYEPLPASATSSGGAGPASAELKPQHVEPTTRFTRTERAVHWIQATTFIILLVSGFAIGLPALEGLLGHRELLRQIHLTTAFFYGFAPLVVALGANRASMARDVHEVERWDGEDIRWLSPGSRSRPGRFNFGQKLNAIFVAWSTLTFVLTGFIMWQNRRFPLEVVSRANGIHTDLAYFALVVFLGHVFLATIWPRTRGAFWSMIHGTTDPEWAREHHPRWQPMDGSAPPSRNEVLITAARIAVGWFAALFAARWLFFAVGANPTDAATSWLYNVTAWPGVPLIEPQTGVRVGDWPALLYLVALILAWWLLSRTGRETQQLKRGSGGL